MTAEMNITTEQSANDNYTSEGRCKPKHITFIDEMAAHGQQRRAYMTAYPGCTPETADRGTCRP